MKIIMRFFKIFILFLISMSCQKKNNGIPTNNTSAIQVNEFKKLALEKGDTIAYSELSNYYMDISNEGLLYSALMMANKYHYSRAYYDVYETITESSYKKEFTELDSLDSKTRSMALDYLIMGADKGNKECQRKLGYFLSQGKYIKKDTTKGKRLIEKGEN